MPAALNRRRTFDARPLPDDGAGIVVCPSCGTEFVGPAKRGNLVHHLKRQHGNYTITDVRDLVLVDEDVKVACRHLWRAGMLR